MPEVTLPEGEGAVKPRCRVPQVFGYLRAKLECPANYGMLEGELFGVQPETTAGDPAAVEWVRVDWVSDGREVDPDLVRPPGLESYSQHRMFGCGGQYLESRHRRLAYTGGHERRVVRVTADGGVDGPRPG